jgi:hypothetical protein
VREGGGYNLVAEKSQALNAVITSNAGIPKDGSSPGEGNDSCITDIASHNVSSTADLCGIYVWC